MSRRRDFDIETSRDSANVGRLDHPVLTYGSEDYNDPLESTLEAIADREPYETRLSLADEAESLTIPRGDLPEYGRFEGARYDLVVSLDQKREAVTSENQRQYDTITLYGATVEKEDDSGATTLALRRTDDDTPTGHLRLRSERLPADLTEPGTDCYVAVYQEFVGEADETGEWSCSDPPN